MGRAGIESGRWISACIRVGAGLSIVGCQAILGLDEYRVASGGTGGGGAAGAGGANGAGAAGGVDGGLMGCGGTCDPGTVRVDGTVTAYDTGLPAAGVVVESAGPDQTTDARGQFSVSLPPGEGQTLTLNWPAVAGETLILPFRRTVLAFDPGPGPARTLEVPAVRHAWLRQVATDCGVLPADASEEDASSYFSERNTILVDVVGGNGAGITRDQVDVYVERDGESYANFAVPDAADPRPPAICFLESGDAGGGLRGSTSDQTSADGKLVIFRVRNRDGSGAGTARVRIVNFAAPPAVEFAGAGLTGAVRVGQGW
jgi:hypothetical protein